jgi:hypothetical protein
MSFRNASILPKGKDFDRIYQLNSATFCACPKPGAGFSKSYVVIFSMFNDLRCEVIFLVLLILVKINVREYRRANQKWTIQRNWQHRSHKTKKKNEKHNIIFVGHHYAQKNTNNVNKT